MFTNKPKVARVDPKKCQDHPLEIAEAIVQKGPVRAHEAGNDASKRGPWVATRQMVTISFERNSTGSEVLSPRQIRCTLKSEVNLLSWPGPTNVKLEMSKPQNRVEPMDVSEQEERASNERWVSKGKVCSPGREGKELPSP